MTPFEPLVKSASTKAQHLVARAAAVAPKPVNLASWHALVDRAATQRAADWRLVPAFVLSTALGVGVVLLLTPAAPVVVPGVELVASPGTTWTQKSAQVVKLSAGQLRVARASPELVHIETPHLEFQASRCRFLAEVSTSGTLLSVEEGELLLRVEGATRVLHAGESLLWPPAPAIPQGLLEAMGSNEARCTNAGPARRVCLEAEARESSLDAQAALFELGSLEAAAGRSAAAIAAWRASLERFPEGVLQPEVRLKLLVELVRVRRFDEAATAAASFEQHCAADPRLKEVRMLAASLEAMSNATPQR